MQQPTMEAEVRQATPPRRRFARHAALLGLLLAGLYAPCAQAVLATGGTVINYQLGGTNWAAHIFTTVGTTSLTVSFGGNVEVLVVAGGGGGGRFAGGGGAGGLIYSNVFGVLAGSHTVIVGDGGAGSSVNYTVGATGANSSFDAMTAYGGGGGGSREPSAPYSGQNGTAGGSGGGGSPANAAPQGLGGSATSMQGYAGGNGGNWGWGGGGGGGAGALGQNANQNDGGTGGVGKVYALVGTNVWYAGGGGGGTYNNSGGAGIAAAGGLGGGGAGQKNAVGSDGAANTGGGGGGGAHDESTPRNGGKGGSGIVIVRYVTSAPGAPTIANQAATSITPTSAELNGYLAATGTSDTAVWVYWGLTDQTTNANLWAYTNYFGNTLTNGTYATNTAYQATFPKGTTCYYNFYAQNASGGVWAATAGSASFTTLVDPVVTEADATGLGIGSATLNGTLTSDGGAATAVYFCWGLADGGNLTTSAWQHAVACGAATSGQSVSAQLTGLTYGLQYWYRVYATNAVGEAWSASISFLPGGGGVLATGGTVTNYTLNGTNYRAHIFSTVGTTSLTFAAGGNVEVLVVAGGGGGGDGSGSGGGAGGYIYTNLSTALGDNLTVVVGAGGPGGTGGSGTTPTMWGQNGSNSVLGGLIAIGGGGGAPNGGGSIGKNGGSGGGGSETVGSGSRGLGTSGQGYDGGWPTFWANPFPAGGGGGAGGVGSNGTTSVAGAGGPGRQNAISGVATWYAAGGGAGVYGNDNYGAGGSSMGGHGGGSVTPATSGLDGTGSGGGGQGQNRNSAASSHRGGSGIVIVRYVAGMGAGIQNQAATNVQTTSATLQATLSGSNAYFEVWALWGPADGATNSVDWLHRTKVGDFTLTTATTNIAYAVDSLSADATCFYTFYARNAAASFWATPSRSFSTALLLVESTVATTKFGDPAGAFTFRRSAAAASESLTVNVTISGSASNGVDYATLPNSVTLAAGATSAVVSVVAALDHDATNEEVVLTLATGSYVIGTPGSATATIQPTTFTPQPQMLITFGGYTNRTTTLTNFPVLVVFSNNVGNSQFSYASFLSAHGYDLRFGTNEIDTDCLNYEIEAWNPNGASYVWVQVPILPANGAGSIWARWGNPADSNQLACTTNGATWSEGFKAVWHLNEAVTNEETGGTNHLDATTNHMHGVQSGNARVEAVCAGGQDLDYGAVGAADSIVFPGLNWWPTNSFSVSYWLKPRSLTPPQYVHARNGPAGHWWETFNCQTGGGGLHVGSDNGTRFGPADTLGAYVVNNWSYITFTFANGSAAIYNGGTLMKAKSMTAPTMMWEDFVLDPAINGMVDEVRLCSAARSADWVWACYQTMASNSVFNRFGAMSVPDVRNQAVSDVTATSATLHGSLVSTGTSSTAVCVLWGDTDCGKSWTWAHTNWWAVDAWTNGSLPSTNITGLTSGAIYYYTFAASNAALQVIAAPAVSFVTGEVTVEATDNTAQFPGHAGAFTLRRPAACAGTALTVAYTLGGSAGNGVDYDLLPNSVTLAAGETNALLALTPLPDNDMTNEAATLTLIAGTYAIGTASNATVTIQPRILTQPLQMKILFTGYTGGRQTLTNFPALIVFSNNIYNSGFDYRTILSTNGYDLRFGTSETDTNSLNYEIESWHTNGASYVWVQVPLLPGDGSGAIWANWAGDGAKLPCTTNGATWTADYQAVWHMQGVNATDATTNHNHATAFGGVSPGSGQVGPGVTLDGTNGYLEVAATDLFKGSDDVTIAFWIKAAASQMANAEIMDYNRDFSPNKNWAIENINGTTPAALQWSWAINNAANDNDWGPLSATRTFVPVSNQWLHVTLVKSGTNVIYYTSGVPLSSATNFANIDKETRKLWIGGHVAGADRFLNGSLDEIRIANAAKSADWVWACYLNQASNAFFAAEGPATVPGAPGALNLPASEVTTSSAICHGWLISTGNAATAVCLLWGEGDAGRNGAWAHTNWFDYLAWTNNSYPSTNLTGLVADRTYYYTFGASNATTNVVASGPSTFFITGGVTVEATDAQAQCTLNDTALFTIRRPATCASEAASVHYALSGSASNGVDYSLLVSNVTMAAGVTSAVVTVTVYPDRDTTNEEVVLTILPGSYAIGTSSNATATILPWIISPEIYVVPAGFSSPSAPYDTWGTAANDIQTAVAYADAFQPDIRTVVVSNGTYLISSQILVTNGITVRSFEGGLAGAANTIVMRPSSAGNSRIVTLSHANAVLDGFTITGGRTPPPSTSVWYLKGGGILVINGTVRNCVVTNNYTGSASSDGAGVFLAGGLVSNCVITANASQKGNGAGLCMIGTNAYLMNNYSGYDMYATGTGTRVTHCIISSNAITATMAYLGAGVYMLGGATLDHSLIYSNTNNGYGAGGGVYSSSGLVQNCTIVNNYGLGAGGGVAANGGVVESCSIASNYGGWGGGGVYLTAGTLSNSLVQANRTAGSGGGIYALAGTIEHCRIVGHTQVSGYGGGVYASATAVLLRNCLIATNSCAGDYGGGVYGGTVESCTIVSNRTSNRLGAGGGVYGSTVTNSIVLQNTTGSERPLVANHAGSTFAYSCTTPRPTGSGNVAYAVFVNLAGGDYRLQACPAVDAGTNLAWMTGAVDLDGQPRTNGFNQRVDMGAWEQLPGALEVGIGSDVMSVVAPSNVVFTAYLAGTNVNATSYAWVFGDGTILSGPGLAVVTNRYGAPGVYTVTLTVVNDASESASATNLAYITVWDTSLYVWTNSPAPGIPYNAWSNAAHTLMDAVYAAPAGVNVFVTNGTYNLENQIMVDKPLTIQSCSEAGFGGLRNAASTVVQTGRATNRLFSLMDAGAVLDGLTVQNGSSWQDGEVGMGVKMTAGQVRHCIIQRNNQLAAYSNVLGGGVYMAGGVVSNCLIRQNVVRGTTADGGGLWASTGLVTHCTMVDNTNAGRYGAGAYVNGAGVTLRNSLICGNVGSGSAIGGGLYLGAGDVANCTIVTNSTASGTGGGVYYAGGTVSNSIVYFNVVGSVHSNLNTTSGLAYSCAINPGSTANGCITNNPLFADQAARDFRLLASSPCANKGTNQAWMTGALDLNGNPRIWLRKVDMGAYEMRSEGTVIMLW